MEDIAQIIDVGAWEICADEARGKRPKEWIRDSEGNVWLWKEPRLSRPYEMPIEVATLALAKQSGLPAATAHLAVMPNARGIIVRRFTDETETLWEGHEILSGQSMEEDSNEGFYDANNNSHHTLARVHAALESYDDGGTTYHLKFEFTRLLLFDMWVGNQDRHAGNWGIVFHSDGTPQLAPIYDTASCLGAELQDGHRLLDPAERAAALPKYIAHCNTGFGDGSSPKMLKQAAVLDALRGWVELGMAAKPLLDWFSGLCDDSKIDLLFRAFPEDWFPRVRGDLAIALLRARLAWLRSVAPCP